MSDTWSAKLNKINQTKEDIKEAIINKGVSVSDSDTFRSYAEKIDDIKVQIIDPIFKNIDDIASININLTTSDWPTWQGYLIKSLDLSTVNPIFTEMNSMFKGYSSMEFVIFPKNIDTSNVTNMSSLFSGCTSLTSLDLSNFDTSSVTSMTSMFMQCSSLTSLDLSNFDTSSVTSMSNTFYEWSSSQSIIWGSNWGSNTSLKKIDWGQRTYFSHDTLLDLFNKLAVRDNSPTLNISTANVSDEEIAIATNKGWTVA